MAIPDLTFNFHDSMLKKIEVGPRREVTLNIVLYSVYHAGAPEVRVRFGAITNFDFVRAFFEEIENELSEEPQHYIRIDALKYDTAKPSNSNDLNFYLLLDCGELEIHRGKLEVTN